LSGRRARAIVVRMARRVRPADVVPFVAICLLALACAAAPPPAAHPAPNRNRLPAQVLEDHGLDPSLGGPPPPEPHDCPALPADSPLRALQSSGLLYGCPSDVELRPGDHQDVSIRFGCRASSDPQIILRARGTTPLPRPVDENRLFDQEMVERGRIAAASRDLLTFDSYYGPRSRDLHTPTPACATRKLGMTLKISDYGVIDLAVGRLLEWIADDDLDTELVIFIVPPQPPGQGRELDDSRATGG
jgi:hypothetical protein